METRGLSHDPEPSRSRLELQRELDEMFLRHDLEVLRILSQYLFDGDDDE